jgi:hypothetical protein
MSGEIFARDAARRHRGDARLAAIALIESGNDPQPRHTALVVDGIGTA